MLQNLKPGARLALLAPRPQTASPPTPAPPPAFAVDAADFDGTNDWLSIAGAMTGLANSKQFTFSAWVNIRAFGASSHRVLHFGGNAATSRYFAVLVSNTGVVSVNARNAANAVILDVSSSAQSSGAWVHILCSCDLSDPAKRHLYVNAASDLTVTTYTDDTIAFTTATGCSVGATLDGSAQKLNGGIAELIFKPGLYIDLSVQAIREKFILGGKPVDPGADAATALGSAALIYQHLDDGEAAANFAVNAGTGGNYTVNGALTTFASSPSD
jgi:hypothetical protein